MFLQSISSIPKNVEFSYLVLKNMSRFPASALTDLSFCRFYVRVNIDENLKFVSISDTEVPNHPLQCRNMQVGVWVVLMNWNLAFISHHYALNVQSVANIKFYDSWELLLEMWGLILSAKKVISESTWVHCLTERLVGRPACLCN